MKQIVNNYMGEFIAHNVNPSANSTDDIQYVGFLAPDGRWVIQKMVTSTGAILFSSGSPSSNGSSTAYESAWTGRAGLTYGHITGELN